MIVVSHRGPLSFTEQPDGAFATKRGAGGVVSALAPLLEERDDVTWIAAAMGNGDRAALAAGATDGTAFRLRLLAPDEDAHRLHYEVVSNATLWFLFHGLFDLPRRPRFDHRFREAWDGYRSVNRVFADEVCEAAATGEIVLVQDLHLALVAGMVRLARPDLRVAQFAHTPFCGPEDIRVLPAEPACDLLVSMTSAPAGFHTPRWASAYRACAREILGTDTDAPTFSASFGPDPEALATTAGSDDAAQATAQLDREVGDRAMIFRTDRIELSKNIVRGFVAYDRLLEVYPEWRDRVVFVAFVYPSREGLAEYLAYRHEVEQAAGRVNERWATGEWQPVLLDTHDDYARSVAGLQRADVLLVNPLRDGLNLVAKEGPLVSRRDLVLCLSRGAGAFDELGEAALEVHAYDVEQNAHALHAALTMDADERAERAARLRVLAAAHTTAEWLEVQVAHASR